MDTPSTQIHDRSPSWLDTPSTQIHDRSPSSRNKDKQYNDQAKKAWKREIQCNINVFCYYEPE